MLVKQNLVGSTLLAMRLSLTVCLVRVVACALDFAEGAGVAAAGGVAGALAYVLQFGLYAGLVATWGGIYGASSAKEAN